MSKNKAQKHKRYHVIVPKLKQNVGRNDNYQHPKLITLLVLEQQNKQQSMAILRNNRNTKIRLAINSQLIITKNDIKTNSRSTQSKYNVVPTQKIQVTIQQEINVDDRESKEPPLFLVPQKVYHSIRQHRCVYMSSNTFKPHILICFSFLKILQSTHMQGILRALLTCNVARLTNKIGFSWDSKYLKNMRAKRKWNLNIISKSKSKLYPKFSH